jgi:hypothetical protein
LPISSVSISANSRQANQAEEGWQQFAQLVSAVNAGDLSAAQKAFANFTQSPASDLAQSHSSGRLAQALGKIGEALQSGDIGQAQQALSAIRPRAQSDQHVGAPTVKAPSIAPPDPNAPGGKIDKTV